MKTSKNQPKFTAEIRFETKPENLILAGSITSPETKNRVQFQTQTDKFGPDTVTDFPGSDLWVFEGTNPGLVILDIVCALGSLHIHNQRTLTKSKHWLSGVDEIQDYVLSWFGNGPLTPEFEFDIEGFQGELVLSTELLVARFRLGHPWAKTASLAMLFKIGDKPCRVQMVCGHEILELLLDSQRVVGPLQAGPGKKCEVELPRDMHAKLNETRARMLLLLTTWHAVPELTCVQGVHIAEFKAAVEVKDGREDISVILMLEQ